MKLKGSQGELYFSLKHPLRCCILELLKANGALSSSELSNLLSVSLGRCIYHLDNLNDLIKKDKRWGRIICRCEHVTEAEVIDAFSNPIGAQTISAAKYRCRVGLGRCQGGFCTQHIVRILEKEFKTDIKKMKLKSPNSYLFFSRTREKKND